MKTKRTFQFRGRNPHGRWFYGSLYVNEQGETFIDRSHWEREPVDPLTVGQYTDLKDKDGLELIYEGDIVRSGLTSNLGEVLFSGYAFRIKSITGQWGGELRMFEFNDLRVVGNIHDNPDIKSYPQTFLDGLPKTG